MRIQSNISAMNAHRIQGNVLLGQKKNMEKLSTGLRINRAADDAAGLSISEKMRAQIRGMKMDSKNALDSISLIQTAEGALNETQAILQRMREISLQAANDTQNLDDRKAIQKEINQLTSEVNRISETTEFNTIKLLNSGEDVSTISQDFYVSKDNKEFEIHYYTENLAFGSSKSAEVGKNDSPAQQISKSDYATYKTVIDNVIDGIVNKGWLELAEDRIEKYYGLSGNVASGIKPNIRVNFHVDAKFGTLASVSSTAANDGSKAVKKDFILNIDLADFNPGTGDSGENALTSSGMKTYNDRILAHEMVHAYLAQYITTEQVTTSYGNVPIWFNEGAAELIQGADERLNQLTGSDLTDTEIHNYIESAKTWAGSGNNHDYAGGYLMVRAIQENGAGQNNSAKDGTTGIDTMKNIFSSIETAAADGLTAAEFIKAITDNTTFTSTTMTGLTSEIQTWAKDNLKTGGAHEVDLTDTDTGAIGGKNVSGGTVLTAESVIDNSKATDKDGQPLKAFNIVMPEIPTTPDEVDTPDTDSSKVKILNLSGLKLELMNTSSSALRISGAAGRAVTSRDKSTTAYYTNYEEVESYDTSDVTKTNSVLKSETDEMESRLLTSNEEVKSEYTNSETLYSTKKATPKYALDVLNHENASAASKIIDEAIQDISSYRSTLGVTSNRLEHKLKNLNNSSENLQAAESRIRDVDIAKEMMKYTKGNILSQAAQSMISQANQNTQSVLQLLR